MTVSARYNSTGMSIIEVVLLSGFAPVERTVLQLLTSNRQDGISEFCFMSESNIYESIKVDCVLK